MKFAIQDAFFANGEPIEALASVMSGEVVGPYKLKIEIVMKRDGSYPDVCTFCPHPEEGCDEPENYLKYCYPIQNPDIPDMTRNWVRLLCPPGCGLDHKQLVDVRVIKRYAKVNEDPGVYVDLFPMLDNVEV